MGAPSKLTDERRERVVQAILAGASQDMAARRGGIAPATHHDWLAKGKASLEQTDGDIEAVPDELRKFAEYLEAIEDARQEWELGMVAIITRDARGIPVSRDGRDTPPIETRTTTRTFADGTVETTVIEKRGLPGNARSATWLLERRKPETWGRVWRAEILGDDGEAVEVGLDQLYAQLRDDVDELSARRRRRQAAVEGQGGAEGNGQG